MASLADYFTQLQRIGELMSKQMTPAIHIHESLQRSIAPLLETQKMVQAVSESISAKETAFQQIAAAIVTQQHVSQQVLGSVISQQQIWSRALEVYKLPNFSQLATQAAEFQESILKSVSPILDQAQRSFHELPPRTQKALLLLGAHGWFMDMEMTFPDLWELEKALTDGNVEEAETALIAHFESRVDGIETALIQKFPHRAHIIRSAFAAHRRDEYELSIPVLLAQTDGICKEIASQYLFRKHQKKPRTAIYVEQIAGDTFQAALLSPLTLTLPISASEDEREPGTETLNRHTVLHGDSLDYGNKRNGLKAISLINYVAHTLEAKPESP